MHRLKISDNWMSQSYNLPQRFDLEVQLGESYIEGKAVSDHQEYRINIQGGKTGIILPNDFEKICQVALVHIFTEKGNELKIEMEIEYKLDWIEIYDDFLTSTLSGDLPVSLTIECNNIA